MSELTGSINKVEDRNGLGIKTVFIRPFAGKLKHDDIRSHFSAFGDVKNVRIRNKPMSSYGFVKFTLPESAAKPLAVHSHLIEGRRVKVAAASDKHQDLTTLPDLKEPRTTLLDLNDDCILEILSMKCFCVSDLCSAAETCHRLKEIVGRVFKKEHKTCYLNSLSEGDTKTATRILRNFGSEIRHLQIDGLSEELSRKVLTAVIEYCSSSSTLQSLELQYFKIPDYLAAQLRPLFKNLKKLKVAACTFDGSSKELFAVCGSLVALDITHFESNGTAFILEKTFPKLRQFECGFGVTSDSLESFISRHMNLKSLNLWYCVCTKPVLQRIADCKQLETLTCGIPDNATLDLSHLGHLCELDINCDHRSVSVTAPGMNNLQFLEHLTLDKAIIGAVFVGILSQLERLRVLKLWWCTGLQNLHRMGDLGQLTTLEIQSFEDVDLDVAILVKRLNKLNSLTVAVAGFKMSLAKYLAIVDAVRQRSDKSKLTFRLDRYYFSYDHLHPDFSRHANLVEMIIEPYLH